ncbi:hypothetical protein CEQ21_04790 [Niallia circulans]|uniref:Uncharacterized protein n=1 Tax=Niallia circulans TaxID=1397 RepID=A0A553STF7_NIACI|nr:hypothetical protein [Niallia circulans]TRZ40256.1 hypothetical protein CEQ21_04790 [Niallia circulans]
MLKTQKSIRSLIIILVFFLVFSVSIPIKSSAEDYDETTVLPSDINEQLDNLIILLKEMNSLEIDLLDIENNSNQQIADLSSEAKNLYLGYEEMVDNGEYEDLVEELSEVEYKITDDSLFTSVNFSGTKVMAKSKGEVKISNATIKKLNELTGWSGGIFGVAAALIKMKLGLSPTALTLLIIAVGGLGLKAVNSCNKYNKGIILKGSFIGPVTMPLGTVTCKPVK